jgi:hemoglobin-like flavoprotein
VGQALIEILQGGLGEDFTKEVKEAYVTFYGMITKSMKEGLNEAYSALNED